MSKWRENEGRKRRDKSDARNRERERENLGKKIEWESGEGTEVKKWITNVCWEIEERNLSKKMKKENELRKWREK